MTGSQFVVTLSKDGKLDFGFSDDDVKVSLPLEWPSSRSRFYGDQKFVSEAKAKKCRTRSAYSKLIEAGHRPLIVFYQLQYRWSWRRCRGQFVISLAEKERA